MMRPGPESEALWRSVERELRRFAEVYERLPQWLWSPETVRLMRAVRPKLERLGELRREAAELISAAGRREA